MSMYCFARENLFSTITYLQMYEESFEQSKTRVRVHVYICVLF